MPPRLPFLVAFLQSDVLVFAVLVAVLRHMAAVGVVLVLEAEHNVALTRFGGARGSDGERYFLFLLPDFCDSSHHDGIDSTSQSPSASTTSVCLCSVPRAHATAGRHTSSWWAAMRLKSHHPTAVPYCVSDDSGHFEGEVVFGHAVERPS